MALRHRRWTRTEVEAALRLVRERPDMTLLQVERRLGLPVGTLSKWVRGELPKRLVEDAPAVARA